MPFVTKRTSVLDDNPFQDESLELMLSEDHILFEQILELTWDMLEKVTVDAEAQRLIWSEQQHLSISESADLIVNTVKPGQGVTNERVEDEIVGWLEMNHIPDGLTKAQFDAYERQVTVWTLDFQKHRSS